jgi:RNA polymerase sigma factor (TIGR02999 family)
MSSTPDATDLVIDVRIGDTNAVDRLFPVVYDELRRIAHIHLASERPDHTLSTTALVHEAYLKLVDQSRMKWQDRVHFCAIASRAMRRILIDHARQRNALKRGGREDPLRLDDVVVAINESASTLLAIDDALDRLADMDERSAKVVEYRFFGGLMEEEIAEVLGTSTRTVRRDWVKARAWLHKEMDPNIK